MSLLTRPLTRKLTSSLTGGVGDGDAETQSLIRPTIVNGNGQSNWDILLPNGTSMRRNGGLGIHGVNWGAFGAHGDSIDTSNNLGAGYGAAGYPPFQVPSGTIAQAVAEAVLDGVQHVRLVGDGRWRGVYTNTPGADSSDVNAYALTSPANTSLLFAHARALGNAAIWSTVTCESNCAQAGTQDAGTISFCQIPIGATSGTVDANTSEVPMIMDDNGNWTVDPTYSKFYTAVGGVTPGYNYFTSPRMFARALAWWRMVATELKSYPYIFAYELCSEPLPPGFYDSTWSPRIKSYFRVLIKAIRQIDTLTPFILGGRGAYNLSPEMGEVLLTERSDCIYTWDRLDNGTGAFNKGPSVCQTALGFSYPCYQNQLGIRSVHDDPAFNTATSDPKFPPPTYIPVVNACMNGGYAVFRAYGIPAIWWQARDGILNDDPTVYGFRYFHQTGTAPNLTYTITDKPSRIAVAQLHYKTSLTSMLAAASAVISGATGIAWWGQQFTGLTSGTIPNMYTDSGVTNVSAVGQSCAWWTPTVGAAVPEFLVQSGTGGTPLALPTVAPTAVSSYFVNGDVGLVDRFPVPSFNGAQGLQGSTTFLAATDDFTITVAFVSNSASAQTVFSNGNTAGSQTYPLIGLNASGQVHGLVTDNAAPMDVIDSVVFSPASQQNRLNLATVATFKKVGTALSLYVDGVLVQTGTYAGGAPVVQRMCLGSKANFGTAFSGTIAFLSIVKTGLSDANRIVVERPAAYLVGAAYLV